MMNPVISYVLKLAFRYSLLLPVDKYPAANLHFLIVKSYFCANVYCCTSVRILTQCLILYAYDCDV